MPRRIAARVGRWVDSESVYYYQAICYAAFIAAGVHAVVLSPPSAVSRAMGETADHVWTVMLIVCPLFTLTGRWVMRRHPAGLWLRLAGDMGCLTATAAYVAAVTQATWGRSASYAGWVSTAIGVCILGVIIRDIRLLRSVRARVRHLDDEDGVS